MPDNELNTTVLERRVAAHSGEADGITIANDKQYEDAADTLRGIKTLDKEIEEFFKPHVKRAHEAHKALKNSENALREPLKKALDKLGRIMGTYQAELERQRRVEQEKLAAQKAAELEKAKVEAEALEFFGEEDAAKEVISKAEFDAQNVAVESSAPKAKGTATLTTWKFEIVDANLILREYLMPDEQKIGAFVKIMKEGTNIPGVRAYSDTKVNARGF